LIERSRPELRALIQEHYKNTVFENGMQIGKSHTIVVTPSQQRTTTVRRIGQQINVSLHAGGDLRQSDVQRQIHDVVLQAIRLEAKSYLPKRLAYLARQHGFSYTKLRFSHSSGRWGSCSSNGTISLNIALMRLPFELIDYVLIHELSHTVEMNHSADFWKLVATCDPLYIEHRARLKEETPIV
jgi:predicted metal-dependent hydrolase